MQVAQALRHADTNTNEKGETMGGIVAVTGAAGALGSEAATILGAAGWTVIGIDLGEVKADGLAMALGGVDLADEGAMEQCLTRIRGEFGHLDALVNIAGGFAWETFSEGALSTWDRLYRMNVQTTFVATRALLPLLRVEGGAIVNLGAAAATRAGTGMGAYAASKAGVARLTEALADELKDSGVRVNAILPSIIDTPANRRDMPDADFARWVSPRQIADVVAFLISPAAVAISGALIPVSGRV